MEIVGNELDFHGHTFRISNMTSAVPTHLLNSFVLETDVRNMWWNIKPGDIVVDVGAGFGSYTLPALACGAGAVIAYEPCREEMWDLMTGLWLNNFLPRCLLINGLAGEKCEAIDSFYQQSHSRLGVAGKPECRFVFPLDNLLLDKLDWVKIDTEGDEVAVLKGAVNTLELHPTLIIENHEAYVPGVTEEVRKILVPLGYSEDVYTDGKGGNNCWSRWTWHKNLN